MAMSKQEAELRVTFAHLMTFDPTVDTPESLDAAFAYVRACGQYADMVVKTGSKWKLRKAKRLLAEQQKIQEARVPGITAQVEQMSTADKQYIVDALNLS